MPEESNLLIIEDMNGNAVNITVINLTVEGSDGITAVRALTKNDPSGVVALLIPEDMADPDVIVEAIRAGARAYIKSPHRVKRLKDALRTC